MTKHPVLFDIDTYRASHVQQPRGYGRWSFFMEVGTGDSVAWTVPHSMSYTDAKKAVTKAAQELAVREGLHPDMIVYVVVAP